jgi:hypothetical protein
VHITHILLLTKHIWNVLSSIPYLSRPKFVVLGFHFSADEPTALVQWEGGPCAVLAPVQAFIIKSLVSESWTSNWREVGVSPNTCLLPIGTNRPKFK